MTLKNSFFKFSSLQRVGLVFSSLVVLSLGFPTQAIAISQPDLAGQLNPTTDLDISSLRKARLEKIGDRRFPPATKSALANYSKFSYKTQNSVSYCANPVVATLNNRDYPNDIATDGVNLYVASYGDYVNGNYVNTGLDKVTPGGQVTNYGNNSFRPYALTADANGNVFSVNFTPVTSVTKSSPSGVTTNFADFAPYLPLAVTLGNAGDIYVMYKISDPQNAVEVGISKVTSAGTKTYLGSFQIALSGQDYVVPGTSQIWYLPGQNRLFYRVDSQYGILDLNTNPVNRLANATKPNLQAVARVSDNELAYLESSLFGNVPGNLSIVTFGQGNPLGQVSKNIALPATRSFINLAISRTTNKAYLIDFRQDELWEVDLTNNTVKPSTKVSLSTRNLTVTNDGTVYFTDGLGKTVRKMNCNQTLTPTPLNISSLTGEPADCVERMASQEDNGRVTCWIPLKPPANLYYDPTSQPKVNLKENSNNVATGTCSVGVDPMFGHQITCQNIETKEIRKAKLYDVEIELSDSNQNVSKRNVGTVYIGGQFTTWEEDRNGGLTLSRPEIVSFNNKLIQAVRGTNNKVYTRELINGQWTAWKEDPISFTLYPVTMAVFNGKIYQAAVGTGNKIYTRSSADGSNWGGWVEKGGQTTQPIAMAGFNGKLYQAVRGNDGRVYTRYATTGENWGNWQPDEASQTDLAPALATFDNKLYLAAVGNGRHIYIKTSSDGNSWPLNWLNAGGETDFPVALGTYDSDGSGRTPAKLYISAVGNGQKIYTTFFQDFGNLANWTENGGLSPDPLSMTQFNNRLYQTVRGTNNKIYTRYME